MVTTKQLIAEIKTNLKTYDQLGLLDELSIKGWIKECIKEFGGNIMTEYQQVLPVKNGIAKLPDNFWALKVAVKCEQQGYITEESKYTPQRTLSYLEWTDIRDYYNYLEGKPCLEDEDSSYITETMYIQTLDKSHTFYYNQPTVMEMVPHIHQVRCDSNCPNIFYKSKYQFSINENHNLLKTNFSEGFVWVWYRGLPCDESGELFIPETSGDKLKNYVIYNNIVKCLERILLNEDDTTGVIQKLNVFKPREREYYTQAQAESISKGMIGWQNRIKNNNRREMNKFEKMFRSQTSRNPYGFGFSRRIR